MTYNAKLTSLHKSLTPIHPEQDRINFAPKLASDIRILLPDNSYLNFNNIDGNGTIWVCSDIDGWWNLPEPSIPNIERGFGDGSFDVSGRNLARNLTFNGSILITESDRASIAESSFNARKQLLRAFDLVKRGAWLIVDEDQYKRACFVRLNGRPDISTVNSRGRIDFSIGLRAPDPIKYEWIEDAKLPEEILNGRFNFAELSSGGRDFGFQSYQDQVPDWRLGESPSNTDGTSIRQYNGDGYTYYGENDATNISPSTATITNNGDADVYCYFRLVGPFYGPGFIQNISTGQVMSFLPTTNISGQILGPTENAPLVEYLDIDTRNREIHVGNYVDGTSTDSSRSLLEPLVDWIYLKPGDNTIYFVDYGLGSNLETAKLQIYWRSGWIG